MFREYLFERERLVSREDAVDHLFFSPKNIHFCFYALTHIYSTWFKSDTSGKLCLAFFLECSSTRWRNFAINSHFAQFLRIPTIGIDAYSYIFRRRCERFIIQEIVFRSCERTIPVALIIIEIGSIDRKKTIIRTVGSQDKCISERSY